MNSAVSQARATLDAWRERGADRIDPVRFRFIEALHRRAAGHRGEARRVLDERLAAVLAAYADDVARAASASDATGGARSPREPARGPLAELVGDIARRAASDRARHAADHPLRGRRMEPDPAMLDYFRETWSRLSAEGQLRQALDQVPRNAGPLNSSSLVHRSLTLMRELSPEYLRMFLSYVDALAWIEQMTGDGAGAAHDAPRAGSAKKSARSKAR